MAHFGLSALGGLCACAVRMDAVAYAPGRGVFAGYSVDYSDATPKPGTTLVAGRPVRFEVRAFYSLQSARRGRLVMFFEGSSGNTIPRPGTTDATGAAIHIERTHGRVAATLSHEITVPTNTQQLLVVVGVYPEGMTTTSGALLLKYNVVPPSREE